MNQGSAMPSRMMILHVTTCKICTYVCISLRAGKVRKRTKAHESARKRRASVQEAPGIRRARVASASRNRQCPPRGMVQINRGQSNTLPALHAPISSVTICKCVGYTVDSTPEAPGIATQR